MFKEKNKLLAKPVQPPTKMHHFRSLLAFAFSAAFVTTGFAAEYRSVQDKVAILYDAPSTQATKRFVVKQGYPFEVVVKLDKWIKVRDNSGTIAWVEAANLTEKRTLIVTQSGAEVREKPDAASKIIFKADKDLLLEFVETSPTGWIKVHHRDGENGFINLKQVWGT